MATETTAETATTSTEETSGQEVTNTNTGTESQATPQAGGNGQQQEPTTATQQDTRLPDDHPLVKAYASSQAELKQLKGNQPKIAELETKVQELTAKAESTDAVQAKYDRLESFLTKVGGPLSKALDSRSFTAALFESDEDVDDIVTKWHKDNPSATSSALQSGAGSTQASKGMSELLRAAAKS